MLKNNIDITHEEHNKYMEKFYDPEFTAYDFLVLFSALSAEQKDYSFDRDKLINFINSCKTNSKFTKILSEINLKSNGVFYYSEQKKRVN